MVEAEAILSGAVDAYRAALGERLVAAYALGSLAHGGFSALVSDIDLGLIVTDPVQPGDGDLIGAVAETRKRAGSDLAERLSVFWGTPLTLRGLADRGRFPPLDRLDLIENGRLLAGVDARSELPRPTAEELLISGAEFALEFLAGVRATSALTMRPTARSSPPGLPGERRHPRTTRQRSSCCVRICFCCICSTSTTTSLGSLPRVGQTWRGPIWNGVPA